MSTFREVQLNGYEILNVVVDLCEKHNLTYYLCAGTLLGAIRHDGFIPWDNDVDIEMPISDYRKFLRIAKKELPENLFLQTYFTDPGYNEMWAKVRQNGTTSMPLIWKDLNIHWGIGIDIFPITGIGKNQCSRNIQRKSHQFCRMLLAKDLAIAVQSEELKNWKLRLIYSIPRCMRIAMCRLLECLVFKDFYNAKETTIVYEKLDWAVKQEAYGSGIMKTFETREFMIPEDYDHILTRLYGDYMTPPPEAERNGHEGSLGKIIYDCNRNYTEYTNH